MTHTARIVHTALFVAHSALCAASAAILDVGPDQPYATPSKAAAAVQDGDTVRIHAGTYKGDVCTWRAHNLVLEGEGPATTILDAAGSPLAQGKAIWVVSGTNTTVRGLQFRSAACESRNGAGIRAEGCDLLVENCLFENNENGILSGANPESVISIRSSSFLSNGHGDGYSHNLYIGAVKRLEFLRCVSRGAKIGHDLKSRAFETIIEDSLFNDLPDGTASYIVNLPNAGRAVLRRCTLVQSPTASNGVMLAYGEEGAQDRIHELTLEHCVFVLNRADGGSFLRAAPEDTIRHTDGCLFLGQSTEE